MIGVLLTSPELAVLGLGAVALVGEVVLSHLRERRDADRIEQLVAAIHDLDRRCGELERWRDS